MKYIILILSMLTLATFVATCQTIQVYKSEAFDKEKHSADGFYYRLPAVRYKVVVKGLKTIYQASSLKKDTTYLKGILSYPIPFIKESKETKEIISVELEPEVIADSCNLFFVKMGPKGLFRTVNFSFEQDPMLIPANGEFSSEGSPIVFLAKVADVAIDVLVPGVPYKPLALTQTYYTNDDPRLPTSDLSSGVDALKKISGIPPELIKDPIAMEEAVKIVADVTHQSATLSNMKVPLPVIDQRLAAMLKAKGIQGVDPKTFSKELVGQVAPKIGYTGVSTQLTPTQPIVASPLSKGHEDMVNRYNEIRMQKRELISMTGSSNFSEKMAYLEREQSAIIKALGGYTTSEEFTLSLYWNPSTDLPELTDALFENYKLNIDIFPNEPDFRSMNSRKQSAAGGKSGFYYRIPHYTMCNISIKDPQGAEVFKDKSTLCIPQLGIVTWLPLMKGYKRNQKFRIDPITGSLQMIAFSSKGLSKEDSEAVTDILASLPDRSRKKREQDIGDQKSQLEFLKNQKELTEFGVNPNAALEELEKENKRLAALIEQLELKKKLAAGNNR